MEEIAEVYARSLFEVAQEHDALDHVHEQLGQFADELDENRDLQVFFFSPYFSSAGEEGRDRQAHRGRRRALRPLPRAARRAPPHAGDLPRSGASSTRSGAEENKLLPVTVTSAVELDEDLVEGIGKRIEEQTGRRSS